MFYRLGTLLPLLLCLWGLLIQPTSSSPLVTQVVGTEHLNRSVEADPPPALSHTCGGIAVPINYDQEVCCVNGYIYLNGQPVEDAIVIVSANGESVEVETVQGEDDHGRSPDDHPAHFGLSLSEEPLNIEAGDQVTITASFGTQTKTLTFSALSRGQQRDIVLQQQEGLSRRADHAMAFDGQHVILFGGLDEGSNLNDSWKWDGVSWTRVTSISSPPSRNKHAMAYDSARQRIVLFGGYQDSENRFDDTWEWNGSTWANVSPAAGASPAPRTSHAMVYDAARGQIVLFGGYDGTYQGDTWVWDGNNWEQKSPSNSPSGRANHAMAYDAVNQRVVLFGGASDGNNHLADTWLWDGTTWTEANPAASPGARYQHTMEYDSINKEVVLFGGINSNNTYLNDTWIWNGTTWLERQPQNLPPARREHAWAYDPIRQRMVLFGGYGQERLGDTWEWDGNNWELGASDDPNILPQNALPIPTINQIYPYDAERGHDSMTFHGSGGDGDATDIIQNYQWTLDGKEISTQASFTLSANNLYNFSVGRHTIEFKVQDDEGTWSEASQQYIYIRDDQASLGEDANWTLLIYAVGDNNLDLKMGDYPNSNGMLYRLRTAGVQQKVQVGVLYDGKKPGDTRLYILAEDGTWTESSWYEDEARMGDPETLAKFIEWGYNKFQSEYYALALVDHANGIVGFGQDDSSPNDDDQTSFLTPLELREALRFGTNDGARKLDVLHYDGCSFGLLEDAAIARGLAHYVVASPYTGWGIFAYETYRQRASAASNPEVYAKAIAEEYALGVEKSALAYTISVFDMTYFEQVNSAVSTLGDTLLNYVNDDPQIRIQKLRNIRDASQKYDDGKNDPDYGYQRFEIENEDNYVDLVDFASHVQEEIDSEPVITAAANVQNLIQEQFVISETHKSGPFYYQYTDQTYQANLDHAHGLGIFYPRRSDVEIGSAYRNYVLNNLFDTTADSGWTRFLELGIPAQTNDDYQPGLSDDELLPPLEPPIVEHKLFLPSIQR